MTITRRTALAIPALLPAVAMATPRPEDPAVAAYRTWRAVWVDLVPWMRRYSVASPANGQDDRIAAAMAPFEKAEKSARWSLAESTASTPEGLLCQLRLGLDVFGGIKGGFGAGDWENYAREWRPPMFDFEIWSTGIDGALYASIFRGAEGMA